MIVVTRLHPVQEHQYSIGYNYLHHNNALRYSIGWEKIKLLSCSCFKDGNEIASPKSSVFIRISRGKKPSSSSRAQAESSVFNRLGEANKVHSFVPSYMKCVSTLDVKIDGSLKVNRRTFVITSCKASSNSKDETKDDISVFEPHYDLGG